jgi:ABC-type transport system involved in cytochrome bd biosynthesis fused ATPase/permease subunit
MPRLLLPLCRMAAAFGILVESGWLLSSIHGILPECTIFQISLPLKIYISFIFLRTIYMYFDQIYPTLSTPVPA